jgi:SAM-dependent methyltransferase
MKSGDLRKVYEGIYAKGLWLHPLFPSERIKLKVLINWLRPSSSDIFLDFGCGSGRYLTEIEKLSECVGLDIAIKPLKILAKANAKVICADGCFLPLRDKSIDKIICIDVIEHIPDDGKAFTEIYRVLKPRGLVLFYLPLRRRWSLEWIIAKISGSYPRYPRDEEQLHLHRYEEEEIRSHLKNCGFKIVKVSYFLHYISAIFNLLSSFNERKVKKGEGLNRIPNLFLKLVEKMELAEYMLLCSLPYASGMFILCEKG